MGVSFLRVFLRAGVYPFRASKTSLPPMTRTAQFAINAATNYGRMLVQILALMVLTPYIIKKIGDTEFGLWTLVISTLGLLSLLDLGFGTGIVKYVAQCTASGDLDRRNRILSTMAAVYVIIT